MPKGARPYRLQAVPAGEFLRARFARPDGEGAAVSIKIKIEEGIKVGCSEGGKESGRERRPSGGRARAGVDRIASLPNLHWTKPTTTPTGESSYY